jgi:hypothetical protein
MVALSHAIHRSIAPSYFARWLKPGRELLVVRLVLPALNDLQVVVQLGTRRDAPPPRLRDVRRVNVFGYLEHAFEYDFHALPRGSGGSGSNGSRPSQLPLFSGARPILEGRAFSSLDALREAGIEWAGAAAVAEKLPRSEELEFAAFRACKKNSLITRLLHGGLNCWQMAVEFSPRAENRLYLPTCFAGGAAPAQEVSFYEELYCQSVVMPSIAFIDRTLYFDGRPRSIPTRPLHMTMDEYEADGTFEKNGISTSWTEPKYSMHSISKRTRGILTSGGGHRPYRSKLRSNSDLDLYD